MWIGEDDERPKIARRSRTARRVMYALFFYSDGIVAHIPVPEHTSVTGTFYKNTVLSEVVRHYTAKRTRAGLRGVKLLHDNTPAHRFAVVMEYF